MPLNEWIVEIKVREGTEAHTAFMHHKNVSTAWKHQDYYVRFLDWVPLTTRDTATPDSPKDLEIENLPPTTLEECVTLVARGWNHQYTFRIKNVKTGEIIPYEVLGL